MTAKVLKWTEKLKKASVCATFDQELVNWTAIGKSIAKLGRVPRFNWTIPIEIFSPETKNFDELEKA